MVKGPKFEMPLSFSETWYHTMQFNTKAKGVSKLADRIGKWTANAMIGIPAQIGVTLLDEIWAIGTTIKAVLGSWGTDKEALRASVIYQLAAGSSLGRIYLVILKIYPWAKVPSSLQSSMGNDNVFLKNGLLTHAFSIVLNRQIDNFARADQHWSFHLIASRGLSMAGSLDRLVIRVIDFVIGVFAAIFSLLTLGMIEEVNKVAYRGLQITHVITSDLYSGVMKAIDPRFFTRNESIPKRSMNLSSSSKQAFLN